MFTEETIAFIFMVICFTSVAVTWYLILFKGYAKKCDKIASQKFWGYKNYPFKFMNHPLIIKIGTSIVLIFCSLGLYSAFRDFIAQFK